MLRRTPARYPARAFFLEAPEDLRMVLPPNFTLTFILPFLLILTVLVRQLDFRLTVLEPRVELPFLNVI